MAIGDQVHWHGAAGNTNMQPSSGVEMIIKDVTTSHQYTSGYHYHMFVHLRTSSTQQSELMVLGGNSYSTGNSSTAAGRASNSSTSYNPNMASAPISNSNYLRSSVYISGYFHVDGLITKD